MIIHFKNFVKKLALEAIKDKFVNFGVIQDIQDINY